MAAAARALASRESAVEKLSSSIRQLRRYIAAGTQDQGSINERILLQKMQKVSAARDLLTDAHHNYGEKNETPLADEAMRAFIDPKVDEADDILDEAEGIIDGLEKARESDEIDREARMKRNTEKLTVKLEISSNLTIVRAAMNKLRDAVAIDAPTDKDFKYASTVMDDLSLKEKELIAAWHKLRTMITEPNEADEVSAEETDLRTELYELRSAYQLFFSGNQTAVASRSGVSSASKVERMPVPKFSGKLRDFARFRADYDSIVKTSYPDEVHQVYVLKEKCLEGEAYEFVKNISDLDTIWVRLKDKYGDEEQIVNSVVKEIQNMNIKPNSDQSLVDFVNMLEKGVQDLKAINMDKEIATSHTVTLIEDKLPRRVLMKWLEIPKDQIPKTGYEKFMKLIDHLKLERKLLERIISQKEERFEKDKEKPEKLVKKGVNALVKQEQDQKPKDTCLIHPSGKHLTRKCDKFKEKSVDDRGKLVKDLGACTLCLAISHIGETCPWLSKWQPCDIDSCGRFHSRLLHGCSVPGLLNCHVRNNEEMSHKTLLLFQTVKSDSTEIVIFWDNGSQLSLVSRNYARRRQLRGIKASYDLVTVNNVVQPQETTVYEVPIKDRAGNVHIIKAYEIEQICQDDDVVDLKKVVKIFGKLKVAQVKRPMKEVDLLIGANYVQLHPDKIKAVGSLALYKSLFGTGRLLGGQHELISGSKTLNAFARIVASSQIMNIRASRKVDFFTAESFGVSVSPKCKSCKKMEGCKECKFLATGISRIELREHHVIQENLVHNPETEEWTTVYPYKEDPSVLCEDDKDNYAQARSMMQKTENRLEKTPDKGQLYCAQFRDFVKRGVFREIPQEELHAYRGPRRYATHHEVYKEDSASTPLRLVLNSSLKFNGRSFNDILMTGPNKLNPLWEVQLRFRSYEVALVCDVKKMYHSIKTTVLERHLRRVLWRDMNRDEEPKVYGTETVMFGDKPAAAIAAIAIRETVDLYKHIDETAASRIKEDMYVDDIATGAESVKAVEEMEASISKMLAKGNFILKGTVKSGDATEESLALLGAGDVGRVLGTGWDPGKDVFVIRVRINLSKKVKGMRTQPDLEYSDIANIVNLIITLRILLGVTNSCYDPYGLLGALLVQLKIELRELYRPEFSLGWDDDIPYEKKVIWCEILQRLKSAENIKFKRSLYVSSAIGDPELIIFVDGSPSAMCAVAYVRWKLNDEEYEVRFAASKTRVTPLQRMTTPRAEIQAAVMGVRLSKSIITSIHYNFQPPIYLSDSTCTLATLSKESTTLNEFFGNRQDECLAHSCRQQWLYVQTDENIADLGTKMNAKVEDINEESEWQNGKGWLRQPRENWPVLEEVDGEVPAEALLIKLMCHVIFENKSIMSDQRMLAHTYSFLMRTTARIFSVFERKSLVGNEVSVEYSEKAEKYWLKMSMGRTTIEFEKGNLDPLRPTKDEDGIICMSSRALKGFQKTYNVKKFPILMVKDPLAYLWMKHVHSEDHSGVTRTLAKSRRKFWVVRGGRLARSIRRSCYTCRKLDKELASQLMAPLPECRLAEAPTFNVTSMDMTGPLTIKDTVKKRTEMKVWGVIFTCAATRAIYLDITDSYSTDSILQAIRKFVSIRGCPSEFISDQGSQLRAASKDLTKDWNWTVVSDWAANSKIKWTIVPAEGQHQNGLSESMIRCTKRTIIHMIGESVLTFSELQLAFFEIANVINTRPIGIVPNSDPECPTPITPNDLLLGRSSNEVPSGPFETQVSITKRFRFIQGLVDDWWKRWSELVLPSLVPSYKWTHAQRNVQVNDICLIKYKALRAKYRLGRVTQVHPGEDGRVRRVTLQYRLPDEKVFRTVERAIHGVSVIVPIEEQEEHSE